MNPFEMVVLIVAISAAASIFRAKYGHRDRRGTQEAYDENGERITLAPDPDAERLRDEVRALKERIHVLERIVTDGERDRGLTLEREIDALRDKR